MKTPRRALLGFWVALHGRKYVGWWIARRIASVIMWEGVPDEVRYVTVRKLTAQEQEYGRELADKLGLRP